MEGQVSRGRDDAIVPVVDNVKSSELSHLHIMNIAGVLILVISVEK